MPTARDYLRNWMRWQRDRQGTGFDKSSRRTASSSFALTFRCTPHGSRGLAVCAEPGLNFEMRGSQFQFSGSRENGMPPEPLDSIRSLPSATDGITKRRLRIAGRILISLLLGGAAVLCSIPLVLGAVRGAGLVAVPIAVPFALGVYKIIVFRGISPALLGVAALIGIAALLEELVYCYAPRGGGKLPFHRQCRSTVPQADPALYSFQPPPSAVYSCTRFDAPASRVTIRTRCAE